MAVIIQNIFKTELVTYAAAIRKIVCAIKPESLNYDIKFIPLDRFNILKNVFILPPQLKYLRTCVVVKYPLIWHISAKYPETASNIPIAKYGAADKNPAFSNLYPKVSINIKIDRSSYEIFYIE